MRVSLCARRFAIDKYQAAIGNQRWNKKPGDPQDMYYGWRLDGWQHITRNDRDTGIESQYRIPAPVDPVNWRPLSAEEKDLFAKRLEKGAKDRRRFWSMRYNPQTEGYFGDTWSDRMLAQFEWANSTWYRSGAGQGSMSVFLVLAFALTIYNQYQQMTMMCEPGMPHAPATDLVNYQVEVIDMTRNNYTPIGYYENGEFKPHQQQA